MSNLLAEVRAEVEALHDFFTGWFTGALPDSDKVFASGLADHLHANFVMVQPSGTVHEYTAIVAGMRQVHGTSPDFRISIRDVRILGEWPQAGLVLAEYIEDQTGAMNTTPPDNTRRSTVLFERVAGRLLWRHLHETALDGG